MKHQALFSRVLHAVVVTSMLFTLVPPVGATPAVQQTGPASQSTAAPVPPSELVKNWPMPELPEEKGFSPILDPVDTALARAMGGITAGAGLVGGNDPVRLEPLTPAPFAGL